MQKYKKEQYEQKYFEMFGGYPTHSEWLNFLFSPGSSQEEFMNSKVPKDTWEKLFLLFWGIVFIVVIAIGVWLRHGH